MHKLRWCTAAIMLLQSALGAETVWHAVEPQMGKTRLVRMKAMAIPAVAEYNARRLTANVFFAAYQGAGERACPSLGSHIESALDGVPDSDVLQFSGPDGPSDKDALIVSFRQRGVRHTFSTDLQWNPSEYFATGFEANGVFQGLSYRPSRASSESWRQFLAVMSLGFEEATLTIGGKRFSKPLTVRFSGGGLDRQLKDLAAYCISK